MKRDDSVYLSHVVEAVERIRSHLGRSSRAAFFKSAIKKAAVVRELEIIGEASRQISDATRASIPEVNWTSVIGMRNRLAHGYFDVDYELVWEVVQGDLNQLEAASRAAADRLGPRVHPWRVCPIGKHWVRTHPRRMRGAPGTTEVDGHCRANRSRKDQIYPDEIHRIERDYFGGLTGGPSSNALGFPAGNSHDSLIRGWTRYWNEVLSPEGPLDPDVVKALIATESGFNAAPPAQSAGVAGKARGLLQLTDQALRALGDERGELKDHLVNLTRADTLDPGVSICAGVRWLFHKRNLAGKRLGRSATWEEAVAEYKAFLGAIASGRNPNPRPMSDFREYLARLKGGGSDR